MEPSEKKNVIFQYCSETGVSFQCWSVRPATPDAVSLSAQISACQHLSRRPAPNDDLMIFLVTVVTPMRLCALPSLRELGRITD